MHAPQCRACGCVQSQQTRCCGWRREFRAPQRQSVAVRRGISTAVCLPGGGWGPSPQQPNYTLVHKYELPTSGAPPVHPRCWMHHHFKGPAATSQDGTNEPNQTNQTNRHNPSRRGLNPLLVYNQRPTPPFSPSGRYCVQYTARPAPHTTRDSSGYELDIRRPSTSTKPSAFRNSHWHGSRAAANPSSASPV